MARLPDCQALVTDTDRCRAVVDDVVSWFGRIDVLSTTPAAPRSACWRETTDGELAHLFDLHLFGPAAMTRTVLAHMRRAGGGTVVQMSSRGGHVSAPGSAPTPRRSPL
jgi:NAD(P)-dependent dehydrogenase (short-subunit alcohol dehydrogenase family)